MRRRAAILVALLAVVGLCAVALPGAATYDNAESNSNIEPVDLTTLETTQENDTQQENEYIQECAADPPEDYEHPDDGNEVIGFVDGTWYNEPLSINTTDGLNQTELENLSKRTAARYEAMRCWRMTDGIPPVEIQTREEYQNNSGELFANISTKDTLYANAQYETTLMIGSDEDYWELRKQNRGSTVGGFYNFVEDRIVIVSDDPDNLLIEEQVLAQELGHAMQDQLFNLTKYEPETTDMDLGQQAIIEGDGNLIDSRYAEACEQGLWEQPCVSESNESGGGGGGELASWGLYLSTFQPYSDGPPFVEYLLNERFDGDWSKVDELYDRDKITQSAYVSVFPEKFGEVDYADVEVPDQSAENWERITYNGSVDYDTFGVAGISAMFMRPVYEENSRIWEPTKFLNLDAEGNVDSSDPLEYAHTETEGWRDDKMFVYRNGDNQTATVWKLAYASEESQEAFLDSYRQLITDVSGGQKVDGFEDTYTFGEDSKYDMALTIVVDGGRITIVKAPSVDALTAVHDIELTEAPDPTPTPTPEPTDTPTPEPTETPTPDDGMDEETETPDEGTDQETETPEPSDDDGAGFGLLVGGVAVLVVLVTALRRRR